MLPRSFYFLRHGETDWNKEKRLQGNRDIPLNDLGREQARLAIPALVKLPIDRIVTSTLSRAYETAEIINEVLQKPIERDKRLCEKNFGFFEGMMKADIEVWRQENPDKLSEIELQTGFPASYQGEAYLDFQKRVLEAKNHFLSLYPEDNILFVAHGGVYSVLNYELLGEKKNAPNAKPFHFIRNAPLQWVLAELE